MKTFLNIIMYLWQLPQNLLGLVMVAITGFGLPVDIRGNNHRLPSSLLFLNEQMRGGISLGRYIIMNRSCYVGDTTSWMHERGHSVQSMMLGPLYLVVIGLPSILWAAWWTADRGMSYYSFYTERWADKLGGVNRC